MNEEQDMKTRAEELEKEKDALIGRIKGLNRRLTYKKYEKKALEPFLEQTKGIRTEPLRRTKRAIEFRIATQAYTPQIEKDLLKELKKIEHELVKVHEVERARRKNMFVGQDIELAEKEIIEIEAKLKAIRDELKKLYDEIHESRSFAKKEHTVRSFKEEGATLGDIGIIEIEKKKE
jgi:uncharacterized coiled-coil DUF342 family protein